jgi:tetratricopeptide (TPR) repeat protein
MRAALFAAGLVAAGLAPAAQALEAGGKVAASPAVASIEPAAALAATAPPGAEAARTYPKPTDALLAGDLDYLVREASRHPADGDDANMWTAIRFVNAFAAGHNEEAREVLRAAPGGLTSGLADAFEPFLMAAEGHVDLAVERVGNGLDEMPAPLPEVARALLFESDGRLQEAAAVYAHMQTGMDLTPPPEGEPTTPEEFRRSLNAARITHALYRAALVQHRLGHADEARRLYGVVAQFAPRSADVEANLARLAHGEQPIEAPLDTQSAAGRWLLFLSEYVTQSETLARTLANPEPIDGLASPVGTLFLQLGVALAPDAQDWRLYAANQLAAAAGYDGALRLLDKMPESSVFAPDAEIARAEILLRQNNDAGAVTAAEHALALGAARWTILSAAGEVYRATGHASQAVSAYDRALTMVDTPKDRADILTWRAYAHRFAGDIAAASADMRSALALDQSADTRLLYVSILMDDPNGWSEGIRVARQLFAEQPDSVLRLNALGYALIQRPEGLEEGYRLLWRGYNFGQTDYAVVDSLGWAYYLHGQFGDAFSLISRADELTGDDRNPEILDHLGDVQWRLGHRDEAREAWRTALDYRPDTLRRRSIESKVSHGLRTPAPRQRSVPSVTLPTGPAERGDT